MDRILFITATRIGDAVLFSGPLAHLVETRPEAKITVACGPLAAPLFRAAPNVERVIVMTKQKQGGHWLDLWLETASRRWDLVVDLRGSVTSWFLIAKERRVNRRRPGQENAHRVREAGAVLGLDPPPAPQVWTDAAAEAAAEARLPSGRPVLALAPAASAPFKEWAPEKFSELANRLTAPGGALQGAAVAIFGGPGDHETARKASAGIKADLVDLTGELDLVEAAACLKRARLFVGNDSGLMHIAAAAGAPALGLFGPTDEKLYGPWGAKARSIRAGEAADEAERARLMARSDSMMGALAVGPVLHAAQKLIAETG
ncbi:MAG: glycosyltransferase family 9 protein [Oceanicaulis sp.]